MSSSADKSKPSLDILKKELEAKGIQQLKDLHALGTPIVPLVDSLTNIMQSGFDEFKKEPTLDVFKSEISKIENPSLQKTIVEQLKAVYTQVGQDDMDYVKKEFSSFCINQNLKEVIIQSVDLLKAGNYDRIKDFTGKYY